MSIRKIAIVEDDFLLSLVISKHFEKLGFESHSFSNGADFLVFLTSTPKIHALILDVKLKGAIDGIELALHIPSSIPIIYCTGNSDIAKNELSSQQIKAVLIKPIDLNELSEIVLSI